MSLSVDLLLFLSEDLSLFLSEDILELLSEGLLLVEFRPPDLWKANHEVSEPLSKDLPLKSTSEQTVAISAAVRSCSEAVRAEPSDASPSNEIFIGRNFGEVSSNWALSGPSWLDSEGAGPTAL